MMKNEIHRKTKDGKLPKYVVRMTEEDVYEVGFKDDQYYSVICEIHTDADDAWEICDALNARDDLAEAVGLLDALLDNGITYTMNMYAEGICNYCESVIIPAGYLSDGTEECSNPACPAVQARALVERHKPKDVNHD